MSPSRGFSSWRSQMQLLRLEERTLIFPRLVSASESDAWKLVFFFDTRPNTKAEAQVGCTQVRNRKPLRRTKRCEDRELFRTFLCSNWRIAEELLDRFVQASFSIAVTCFVCIVLCVASVLLSDDANRLVLTPLEKMIHKVEACPSMLVQQRRVRSIRFPVTAIAHCAERILRLTVTVVLAQAIRRNPLAAIKMADDEHKAEEIRHT
eukprot:5199324-Amphidinium_carterae.1